MPIYPLSLALIGGDILTPLTTIENGAILIQGGQILDVGSPPISIPDGFRVIDASDQWVVPGYIDLHTHGLMGFDNFGPGLADAIAQYPKHGVTSFLATTMSATTAVTIRNLSAMARILREPPAGAQCLGIHLEGPCLSPEQPGVAKPIHFRKFDWAEFDSWQQAAAGQIRLITLAPEELDSVDVIGALKEIGVIASAGHTNASLTEMKAAIHAGLRQVTHAFNAMSGFHHRQPGAIGAVLISKEIFAEVIADGYHVHPAALNLLLQTIGHNRMILVSDSAPMAGLPEGNYQWADQSIAIKADRILGSNGELAGSYQGIDSGIRTMVNRLGLALEPAIAMATTTPAKALGLTNRGQLSPGMVADVICLNKDLRPTLTIVGGRVIWSGK